MCIRDRMYTVGDSYNGMHTFVQSVLPVLFIWAVLLSGFLHSVGHFVKKYIGVELVVCIKKKPKSDGACELQ